LSLAFASLALAVPARAQDHEVQSWTSFNAIIPVAERVSTMLEMSPRLRPGPDLLQMPATGEVEVDRGLRLGGGALLGVASDSREFRLHQQLIYRTGPLILRTRLEQRWFSDAPRTAWRLRQRAELSQPIDARTRITIAGEMLYTLRSEVPGVGERVDQLRAEIVLHRKLGEAFELSAGYRPILAPRGPAEDSLRHVALVNLTWAP
jgi:hypothetical protein